MSSLDRRAVLGAGLALPLGARAAPALAQAAAAPAAPAVPEISPMVALFQTYTASDDSLGSALKAITLREVAEDPLIVATSTDMVVWPGRGRPPAVQSFRLNTPGFRELAGVSHLGPACGSLVLMREREPEGPTWTREAERLLAACATARAANSAAAWRDTLAIDTFRGREADIAAMLDYGCGATMRFLRWVLEDGTRLTGETLRRALLDTKGAAESPIGAPIPLNAVMCATFFLVGLNSGYRLSTWFAAQGIDWERAMVVVAGQQGRPTAGVTLSTSSISQVILGASGDRLPADRLYIAPHAPEFDTADPAALAAGELAMRALWSGTRTTQLLAPAMFEGYPRYVPAAGGGPAVDATTQTVSDLPAVRGLDDWRAMTTRLRVVLEDPRQLLAGCMADIAVAQLRAAGGDPTRAGVPGLTGFTYPMGF